MILNFKWTPSLVRSCCLIIYYFKSEPDIEQLPLEYKLNSLQGKNLSLPLKRKYCCSWSCCNPMKPANVIPVSLFLGIIS